VANLPSQERTIGEHAYRVTMLPMGQWLELESLVLRIAGPAIAEAMAGAKNVQSLGDLQIESLGGALHRLSQAATAAEQERLLTLLGQGAQADGHTLTWGEMRTWWPRFMRELAPFVAFALEVQLADFFDGLKSGLGISVVAPAVDEPASPST